MSARNLSEFTGLSAIPPVGMPARKNTLPKKKLKKSAVAEFVAASTARLVEAEPETEKPAPAPAAAPPAPAPASATPAAAPAAPSPAAAPTAAAAPAEAPAPVAEKALRISREVLSALNEGRSVTVRGVLLEPAFSVTQPPRAPAPAAAPPAPAPSPAVESAAARMAEMTNITESAPVDMNAAQPPPAPSTNGKAVSSAFRRFGGAAM